MQTALRADPFDGVGQSCGGAILLEPARGGRKVKVAVIGPNAKERVISGGGSAQLKASYVVTPYEGLVAHAPEGVEMAYEVGCYGD